MDLSALIDLARQIPEPLANLLLLLLVAAVARGDRQLADARQRLAVLEAVVRMMPPARQDHPPK